jgi:hypothetical protein
VNTSPSHLLVNKKTSLIIQTRRSLSFNIILPFMHVEFNKHPMWFSCETFIGKNFCSNSILFSLDTKQTLCFPYVESCDNYGSHGLFNTLTFMNSLDDVAIAYVLRTCSRHNWKKVLTTIKLFFSLIVVIKLLCTETQ